MHGWAAGWIGFVEKDTEIIDYAASNDIVVLYPFAKTHWFVGESMGGKSPDWDKRHTNKAVQPDAVHKMIRHLIN